MSSKCSCMGTRKTETEGLSSTKGWQDDDVESMWVLGVIGVMLRQDLRMNSKYICRPHPCSLILSMYALDVLHLTIS